MRFFLLKGKEKKKIIFDCVSCIGFWEIRYEMVEMVKGGYWGLGIRIWLK